MKIEKRECCKIYQHATIFAVHSDLWADEIIGSWWLGLIDNANNLLYSWVDGSLMTFLKFKDTPEDEYIACAVDTSKHSYQWLEAECDERHNVMCKKPAGDYSKTLILRYQTYRSCM